VEVLFGLHPGRIRASEPGARASIWWRTCSSGSSRRP